MSDEEIEDLIKRRDAGDSEAEALLCAWIEECLARMLIAAPGDADELGRAHSGTHAAP